MNQTERQVGERFTVGNVEVVTIDFRGCRDCYLFDTELCSEYSHVTGSCMGQMREDGKNVCFMPVEKAKQYGLINI